MTAELNPGESKPEPGFAITTGMKFSWSAVSFWMWPVAVLAAISLHFWFPEWSTGAAHDSYSPTALGQKAFYRLVARHPRNLFVSRNRRPLAGWISQLEPDEVLCILGPERSPTNEEWSAISDWVRNGGSLLYAFQGDKPQEIPWLRVKYFPDRPDQDDLKPETKLTSSNEIAWWTDGKLETKTATSLLQYDGTMQAVSLRYGIGKAVVVATSLPFANQALTYGDNSVLAIRLLEEAGNPQFVTFDESLNSSGTAKQVGILFDPILRPVTIQILIVTLLYGWWHSRRFGSLAPPAVLPRQNIVEHTDMVGSLYWKTGDGHAVLKSYLRQLTSRLKLKTFRGKEDRVLEPIARRSGRSVAKIRSELQAAYQAVRSKQVDRRMAARLIRQLAELRRDADQIGARR